VARKRQRFRKALRGGESVADALYGAGYGSPSRVYETSDKALGMTPATYAKGGAGAHIDYTTVDSDYGRVLVAAASTAANPPRSTRRTCRSISSARPSNGRSGRH
jgi:AraC family transcriptional regulator of adaptative response/methylated-DNA-[protein]-cysteine methyltransferase